MNDARKSGAADMLKGLLARLFDIREGEWLKASLMWLYIFLIISSLMIIKPTVNSLFLSQFGAAKLPYVFILVALFATGGLTVYSRVLKTTPLDILIIRTLQATILAFLVFWVLLFTKLLYGWTLYVFYVVVAIFAVISTSQFWILANLVFNPREAKRLFGFIGAGAIAGGIFGGYLTNFLAPVVGSANLIFVCTGLLSLCIPTMKTLWRDNARNHVNTRLRQKEQVAASARHPLQLIVNSRHLSYLACIVGISVLVAKFVEYQFSAIASTEITDDKQLTAFFGFWLSNLNIASLLIQLLLTRRIVGAFGVGTSLFLLPLGILVGAVTILVQPVLWAAIAIKISEGSLKQSINKAGIELISLPIPSEVKNQAKTFIDVFVDSIATGLGGLLLIVITSGLGFSVQMVSAITIVLVVGWLALINKVRHEYIHLFRLRFEAGEPADEAATPDLKHKSVWVAINDILENGKPDRILSALKMARHMPDHRLLPGLKKLLRHPDHLVRLQTLRILYFFKGPDLTADVTKLVSDPELDLKTEALHYIFRRNSKNRVSLLKGYFDHEDEWVRAAALLCVARESRNNAELRRVFNIREAIEGKLQRLAEHPDQAASGFTKIVCARAIGAANLVELYPYLHIFLNDPLPPVVKAAIIGAGETRNLEFIHILIKLLAPPEFRSYARGALRNLGPEIIDILLAIFNNPKEDFEIRRNIPRVLSGIGVEASAAALLQSLAQRDQSLRFAGIKALNRLRSQFPHLTFNEKHIEKKILEEAQLYISTLGVLYTQIKPDANKAPGQKTLRDDHEIKEARLRLVRALEERLDQNLERIFRLLGLRYPPDDIYKAYLGLQASEPDLRFNAVEFLDNLLEVTLKRVVMPIVETAAGESLAAENLERIGLQDPSEFEYLQMILPGSDAELKGCILELIGQLGDDRYVPSIGKLLNSPEPRVREMAALALTRMGILPAQQKR